MADITNPFYPEVLEAFALQLREHDLVAQLYCVPQGIEVDTVVPELFRHRVAGVVLTSATLSSDLARTCRERHLPVVLFNRSVPSSDVTSVACDNYAGGRQVAELLLRSGHERIAFLAGREDTSTNRERERGLRDGLAIKSREVFAREVGLYTYEGALDATRRLMSRKGRPDAIFCANDIMALAAIDVVSRETGLRIPDDVSIVGFDDIAMAKWPAYRLTTVRQRVGVMIDETIELLQRLMADPDSAGATRLVPGILIERATSRLPMPSQMLETGTRRARRS
jgi:DNA-binding LacI/PurR family transcriptional regulator